MVATADIEAGYENVTATCPKCGARNVYNRATDIGHLKPIANHRVACEVPGCQEAFDICGDLINPAHETLLLDSYDFLKAKRFMQSVLSATTAYESFFSHFLRVELVYRPSLRDTTPRDDIAWLNAAAQLLQDKTSRHTFEPMRRVFLRLTVDDFRPSTTAAAEDYVRKIPERPPEVPRSDVDAVSDAERRALLLSVHGSRIATMRNDVVHKRAYRPSLAETKAVVDDAYTTIFRLGHHYNLGNDDYHLNEDPADL